MSDSRKGHAAACLLCLAAASVLSGYGLTVIAAGLGLFADTRVSVAVVTTGCLGFDGDDLAKAEVVLRECGPAPRKVRTPRGLHPRYRRRMNTVMANVVGIEGQREHDRTMRAAGILIQKFGLTVQEAWPLFKESVEQCSPIWDDANLLRKLHEAVKNRT